MDFFFLEIFKMRRNRFVWSGGILVGERGGLDCIFKVLAISVLVFWRVKKLIFVLILVIVVLAGFFFSVCYKLILILVSMCVNFLVFRIIF